MSMNEVVKKLSQAIDKQADKAKTTAYDTPATVRRIEGDTAWVHIPGGVDETPVKLTISAKEGDQVQVRVSGGSAFMVGNGTNPPTDDARANEAYAVAGDAIDSATMARTAALTAEASAASAQSAAASAQANAAIAKATTDEINNYADSVSKTVTQVLADGETAGAAAQAATEAADSALYGLSTVEDVVGVLNWITAHGTMTLTSDVTVNPAHVYFIVDAGGDYVVGGTHYSIVSEPKDAELSTYYELTVDESVQNYVATHIVVDTEGLWIVPDSGGNKVLIATGSGSTYTTAGTYIVGKVGGVDIVLASFTASGARIGQTANGESRSVITSNGMQITRRTSGGTDVQVANLGYGPGNDDQGGTSDAPFFTFGTRNDNNVGNRSVAEGEKATASGTNSHAEGKSTTASGSNSHAEGLATTASHATTHAEGRETTASGPVSHAEGRGTTADGAASHAQNHYTIATSNYQTALGKYNVEDNADTYAAIIGNGTSNSARSNALTVDWSGNVMSQGMAGMIQMFAGSTAPAGWLICDGSAVSRTTYATLFAVIETTYGTGDGSTTFNLPDLRGRVAVGVGTGTATDATAHALGQYDGAETVTLTENEIPSHTHGNKSLTGEAKPYTDVGLFSGQGNGTGIFSKGSSSLGAYRLQWQSNAGGSYSLKVNASHEHNSFGGGNAHKNMQPYLAINYIIATGKTS